MKNEKQIIYLAGIMDGEGTFYIGKCNGRFDSRLYIVNTDDRLIKWLHEHFGGLIYNRISTKNPHWKRKFEWVTNKSQILPICEAILPFLICKKEQAEIMIKFRKTFDREGSKRGRISDDLFNLRLSLLSDLRNLNQRCSPI